MKPANPCDSVPPIWVALLFEDGPVVGFKAMLPVAMRLDDHYISDVPGGGRACYVVTTPAIPVGNDPLLLAQSLRLEANWSDPVELG
jgi:hypothetical protein